MSVSRNLFQKIPFLRITSLFMAGILSSHFLSIDIHWVAIAITILISTLIFLWHTSKYERIRIQNLVLALVLFASGIFYPQINAKRQISTFNSRDYFLAEVCQKPAEKAKSFQTILKIQNRTLANPEKIVAYFGKKSFDSTINIGDQLIILAKPQEIKNQGNPFETDYQALMHKKGIWFSVYLPEGTYLRTGKQTLRPVYLAEKIRQKMMNILAVQLPEKDERSVVSALTLGYRAELDPNTVDYFASTGAMHVLAVSGLHVGLIFFILSFLLAGIKTSKAGQFVYPVIIILFLWIYAFITGFSASVQRATIMFTFVILGNIIQRPVNIFNSLSASAFVLILINPEVILELGFQLSYLAVFGIVLIQPQLAKLIVLRNKILKFMWDLFTVSVAAQLATFPLGLFYFNQFPNLFWISNFLVIPGATIIIWLTFGFFFFSFIPFLSAIFAFLMKWVTHFMIDSLRFLSELPHAVSEGIIISQFQVWIIYGILSCIIIYGFSKHRQWLFYCLILFAFFQITTFSAKLKLLGQHTILVYNSPNKLIHLINGRDNYLISLAENSPSEQEYKMTEKVRNHLKLGKTQFIRKNDLANYTSNDLIMKDNNLQFLNCLINLPVKSGNANKFQANILKLHVCEPFGNEKSIYSEIQIGGIYFQDKTKNKIAFNIQTDGCYSLSLK